MIIIIGINHGSTMNHAMATVHQQQIDKYAKFETYNIQVRIYIYRLSCIIEDTFNISTPC